MEAEAQALLAALCTDKNLRSSHAAPAVRGQRRALHCELAARDPTRRGIGLDRSDAAERLRGGHGNGEASPREKRSPRSTTGGITTLNNRRPCAAAPAPPGSTLWRGSGGRSRRCERGGEHGLPPSLTEVQWPGWEQRGRRSRPPRPSRRPPWRAEPGEQHGDQLERRAMRPVQVGAPRSLADCPQEHDDPGPSPHRGWACRGGLDRQPRCSGVARGGRGRAPKEWMRSARGGENWCDELVERSLLDPMAMPEREVEDRP
jgi:hypothetical protein